MNMKRCFSLALVLTVAVHIAHAAEKSIEPVRYRIQLDVISEGYDGKTCWFHPRAGAIPGTTPTVVLTMQKLNLMHSDVFYPITSCESSDLGKTWSPIVEHAKTLGRKPLGNNLEEAIADFTPKWHAGSGKLLATGVTTYYSNDKLVVGRRSLAVCSVYEPKTRTWTPAARLVMPK